MTRNNSPLDLDALKPLAAEIEAAILETPIRLGSNDWGTMLGSAILARVAVFMGRELGPDARVLAEVQAERERQDAKWGEQNHPDGTGSASQQVAAGAARARCQVAAEAGEVTWRLVSDEEHAEAMAESDPLKLRAELIQDAAVKVAWIAAIDRHLAAARPSA